MEKEQHQSMIGFIFLDGKMYEEIKDKLNEIYNNHAPSTADQKQNRMTSSKQCLVIFKCNPTEFLWH